MARPDVDGRWRSGRSLLAAELRSVTLGERNHPLELRRVLRIRTALCPDRRIRAEIVTYRLVGRRPLRHERARETRFARCARAKGDRWTRSKATRTDTVKAGRACARSLRPRRRTD